MLKYVAKGEDREHKQGKYLNQRWQGGPKTISVIIFIRVPLEVWALRNMVTENNTPSTKSVNLLTIVLLQEFLFILIISIRIMEFRFSKFETNSSNISQTLLIVDGNYWRFCFKTLKFRSAWTNHCFLSPVYLDLL